MVSGCGNPSCLCGGKVEMGSIGRASGVIGNMIECRDFASVASLINGVESFYDISRKMR